MVISYSESLKLKNFLESDILTLDLNNYYQQMTKMFDELPWNCSEFMRGFFFFFLESLITNDKIY